MLCTDKSNFEKNWQPPLDFLAKNPNFTEDDARAYIQSDIKDDVISGYIMATAMAYKNQDETKLLRLFAEAQECFTDLPEILRIMRLSYHAIKGDLAESAYGYALASFKSNNYNQALEEMRIAFVADYRTGSHILNDPKQLQAAMALYKKTADSLEKPLIDLAPKQTKKLRLGMLVPNLVDDSVAYSKRVMFFARYLDRELYELKVYSSEDLAREGADSYQRAKKYIKELEESGIDFWTPGSNQTMTNSAIELSCKLEEDQLDALIMQIDPAMPIAWLASYLAKVRVKAQIHIGSAIYLPGLDSVLYDNETVMNKDAQTWPSGVGEQKLLRRGTDIEAIDRACAKTKVDLGLSDNAILLGCLSNHLANRMSDDYKEIICKILETRDNVYFMPIGNIDDDSVMDLFLKRGLRSRLILPGGTKEATSYLKALDIYACEFPEGGSQAIVEAMVCSLPIVAMHCGQDHHKSIAAEIVGLEWAIEKYDLSEYEQRLFNLVDDPAFRAKNAEAMRSRAVDKYSVKDYVAAVADMLKEINDVS